MSAAEREAMQRDVEWLENGWRWLAANEADPRFAQIEDAWLTGLRKYEQAYRVVFLGEEDCHAHSA